MSTRFTDYKEVFAFAQKRANDYDLPQAIRAVKEYGKLGFNVSGASKNDSDYALAEIIYPGGDVASRHMKRNPKFSLKQQSAYKAYEYALKTGKTPKSHEDMTTMERRLNLKKILKAENEKRYILRVK